ncbi:MAG: CPBP family glutamic-type intramembrane protease [Waterburya sp.]
MILGSLGVFLAGIIWAWCFSRYQSLVPSYLSHILADIAIAIIGWQLLFTN